MNGCLVLTLCALAGQPRAHDADDIHFERLAAAREALTAAHAAAPGKVATALKLVAVQVLSGDYQRATAVASGLFARGSLSVRSATARSGRHLERAFAALVARPADVAKAGELLTEALRAGDPTPGDIALPFAKAFVLARGGESHAAASALERLAQRLRDGAGLQVANVRFATRVTSFGVYTADARRSFRPGDSLLLYAEPRGFRSSTVPGRTAGGERWRVHLRMTVSLHDLVGEAKTRRWGPDDIAHVTSSLIHDLHVTRLVELPAEIAPGAYELRVSVEDLTGEPRAGLGIKRLTVGE